MTAKPDESVLRNFLAYHLYMIAPWWIAKRDWFALPLLPCAGAHAHRSATPGQQP